MMKKLLIIPLLFISLVLSATNYYVKNGGSDAANGLTDGTAWETINKVRTTAFSAGDSILFKRGDTWTVLAAAPLWTGFAGTAGNEIVFGAYGTGNKPVFTGFTEITSWTDEGGGIYSKVISTESNADIETFIVTIDGVNTPMGRYPETGWLTYEHHIWVSSTVGRLVDHQTLSGTTNWTGAEAVVRKWATGWMVDRNTITAHSNDTITYHCGTTWEANDGFGYFIQRDIRTLTYFGAWYYDLTNTKLYMYFGAVDPTTKTVNFSTVKKGALATTAYITFHNLDFQGFNNQAILNQGGGYCTVKNCNIQFTGVNAVYIWPYTGGSSYMTIDNNTISHCAAGIELASSATNITITNNALTDIGLIQGGCALHTNNNWGDGIIIGQDNTTAQYNTLHNIGHIGIRVSGYGGDGDNVTIQYNFVDSVGLTRYDAGGIYTQNPHSNTSTGWVIDHNIVLNGKSTLDGMGAVTDPYIWGIYLDQHSINVTITNNTAANFPSGGLFLFASSYVTATDNLFYNNGYQLDILDRGDWVDMRVTNCDIENNIFFSKAAADPTLHYISSDAFNNLGTVDYNYYARPEDDNLTIQTAIGSGAPTGRTLAGWQVISGDDAHSHKSPIAIADTSDIDFYYNTTNANYTVTVTDVIDVEGNKYSTSVILGSYHSIVVMPDPDPATPVVPVPTYVYVVKYNGKVVKYNGKTVIIRK